MLRLRQCNRVNSSQIFFSFSCSSLSTILGHQWFRKLGSSLWAGARFSPYFFFFLHCFQHPPHGLCVHRMMPAGQVRVNSRHSLLLSHISDRLSSIAMRDPEHFLNNICQLSLSTDVMALNRVSLSCMRVQSCLVTTVEHC